MYTDICLIGNFAIKSVLFQLHKILFEEYFKATKINCLYLCWRVILIQTHNMYVRMYVVVIYFMDKLFL